MYKDYDEVGVTWSSIEKYYDYSKVDWKMTKNGIPTYILFDENGNEINVDLNNDY